MSTNYTNLSLEQRIEFIAALLSFAGDLANSLHTEERGEEYTDLGHELSETAQRIRLQGPEDWTVVESAYFISAQDGYQPIGVVHSNYMDDLPGDKIWGETATFEKDF